jgi:hypothetical protein
MSRPSWRKTLNYREIQLNTFNLISRNKMQLSASASLPTFYRQSAHRRRWGCQPYVPAALCSPGRFLVLISVRGWVDPRTIVRLEGLGLLKNQIISSGIEAHVTSQDYHMAVITNTPLNRMSWWLEGCTGKYDMGGKQNSLRKMWRRLTHGAAFCGLSTQKAITSSMPVKRITKWLEGI